MYTEAACRHEDPELFFPDGRGPARPAHQRASDLAFQVAYAKSFCDPCPARLACLEQNLDVPYGIFGGLTQQERARIRRDRGIPARNMSPFPNERAVLAQRRRREAETQARSA